MIRAYLLIALFSMAYSITKAQNLTCQSGCDRHLATQLGQVLNIVQQFHQLLGDCKNKTDITTAMPSTAGTESPTTTPAPTPKGACPYYFTELPGTGSCYMRVFKDRLNWMDAEESCMSVHNKTHLVVIDNAVEHDAIVTWLKKIGGAFCGSGYWTAGQRVDVSRLTEFVWKKKSVDSYQELPLDYTNWLSGEPNNHGGDANNVRESCVQVWPGRQYLWNDEACGTKICYICEYDL